GEEIETSYWLMDPQADPELQYESTELESVIQKCMDKLPSIYRLVLVLVDVEGLSYEEAASAAGVPVGTVKSRLARARLQMQKSLQMSGELLPASYQVELPLSV
ncbi:MAG TPA: RNA polymerase sigma factor, partial [Anaerolineales bacterium]|nr:RNA polymerase sigma factor [Anaerolineales bacterium]